MVEIFVNSDDDDEEEDAEEDELYDALDIMPTESLCLLKSVVLGSIPFKNYF